MSRGLVVKRASLVRKTETKRSPSPSPQVVVGSEEDSVGGFTRRILLSLVVDVTELRKTTERLQVQVFTLARAHGIEPPDMDE
jgi:hypothetical protein